MDTYHAAHWSSSLSPEDDCYRHRETDREKQRHRETDREKQRHRETDRETDKVETKWE